MDIPERGLVSVVMPVYRQALFVRTAIDSVLRQTHVNWELIVVDDGSDDGTFDISKSYEIDFPGKIRVVRHALNSRRGIVETYQKGIDLARGEYLSFIEGDDQWSADNLRSKVSVLDQCPQIGVVYSDYQPFGHRGGTVYWNIYRWANRISTPKRKSFDALPVFLFRNPVASFTHFVTRTELFRAVVPAVPRGYFGRCFDWWSLAHLSLSGNFLFIPAALSRWRIHSSSAGFGKVRLRTLVELHRFLWTLCSSLLSQTRTEVPRDLDEPQSRLPRILQSFYFHEKIRQRNWFAVTRTLIRHPLQTARFLVYVTLKNLLFSFA